MPRLPFETETVFVLPLPGTEIVYVAETRQILSRIKIFPSEPKVGPKAKTDGVEVQDPRAGDVHGT